MSDMYESFSEYWQEKKSVFEQLGVNEDVARMIWCDAIDNLANAISTKILKN